MRRKISTTVFSCFIILHCQNKGNDNNTPGSSPAASSTTSFFQEATSAAGLNYSHSEKTYTTNSFDEMAHGMTGGLAAGDINGDGYIDLFLTGGNLSTNRLLLNNGSGVFTDVTTSYGLGSSSRSDSGPAFIDFDGDNDLDLIVGNIGETTAHTNDTVRVYRNDGTTFTNITGSAGISFPVGACPGTESDCIDTYNVSVGDIDNDGWMDVYLGHWSRPTSDNVKAYHLWKNNGNSTFSDVTTAYGLDSQIFTFTAAFADIDGNAFKDLIAANDFNGQKLWLNTSATPLTSSGISFPGWNAMGLAVGDIDNDGDNDWMFTHIYDPPSNSNYTGNRMWRNEGGSYTDISASAGIAQGSWGWGICFADFNNDTYLDIFHVNGMHNPAYNDTSVLFINNGDSTFTNKTSEYGISDSGQGRGVVCFDADRDGDIDIVVFNNNGSYKYYRNNKGNEKNWITIRLQGNSPNTKGIGSKITITAGSLSLRRDISADNHYAGQNPAEAHFGLGSVSSIDTITVNWADGATSNLSNVSVNQTLTIAHP